MKILVTGSSGFIGNMVCKELEKIQGISLIRVASKKDQETSSIKFFNLNSFDPSVNYYQYFGCPDMMLHCAWQGVNDVNNVKNTEQYLYQHKKIIENLISNGLVKLAVLGSGFEYGKQHGEMTEGVNDPLPNTSYAEAKNALRKYIESLDYDFIFQWLRVFYVYDSFGLDGNNIINLLKKSIVKNDSVFNMSKGEQILDYIEVRDLAKIISKVILQDKVTGCINCCTGKPISLLRLIEERLEDWNESIKLNKGFYSYREFESLYIWGSTVKMNLAIRAYAQNENQIDH